MTYETDQMAISLFRIYNMPVTRAWVFEILNSECSVGLVRPYPFDW